MNTLTIIYSNKENNFFELSTYLTGLTKKY
jgi:hypothetical protein